MGFFSHPGSLPFLTPSAGGTECSSFYVLNYWVGQKVHSGCPIISYRKRWMNFLVDPVSLSCCLTFHLPWKQAVIFSHLNSRHCLCSLSSTLSRLLKSHPIPQVWLGHPLYQVLVISEITHFGDTQNPSQSWTCPSHRNSDMPSPFMMLLSGFRTQSVFFSVLTGAELFFLSLLFQYRYESQYMSHSIRLIV